MIGLEADSASADQTRVQGLGVDSASADQTRVQGLGADIPTFLSLNRLALPLIVVIASGLDDLRLSLTLPLIENLIYIVMMMFLVVDDVIHIVIGDIFGVATETG